MKNLSLMQRRYMSLQDALYSERIDEYTTDKAKIARYHKVNRVLRRITRHLQWINRQIESQRDAFSQWENYVLYELDLTEDNQWMDIIPEVTPVVSHTCPGCGEDERAGLHGLLVLGTGFSCPPEYYCKPYTE